MTPTVIGWGLAFVVAIVGVSVGVRLEGTRRVATIGAALVASVVIGWFSWLIGMSA